MENLNFSMKIPCNLEECLETLDNSFASQNKDAIKNGEIGLLHHGIGTSIRNNWGLWTESCLRDWFNKHDVWHADDMSTIILESYKRHLNNQPIDLEGQVQYYNDHWASRGVNIKEEVLQIQARAINDK